MDAPHISLFWQSNWTDSQKNNQTIANLYSLLQSVGIYELHKAPVSWFFLFLTPTVLNFWPKIELKLYRIFFLFKTTNFIVLLKFNGAQQGSSKRHVNVFNSTSRHNLNMQSLPKQDTNIIVTLSDWHLH
jgi:hypothetical protein